MILISGGNGQLAQCLKDELDDQKAIFLSKEKLDITNIDSLKNAFEIYKPKYFINTAAFTNVEAAQDQKAQAFELNAYAVKKIAEICNKYKTTLIQISTDYVFNGEKSEAYSEEDVCEPINIYGQSKLAGENKLQDKSIILRTSWLYSLYGKNFVRTIYNKLKETNDLTIVDDQIGSPTNAHDLAKFIKFIIEKNYTPNGVEVFHFCNHGKISWYEFAQKIKEFSHSETVVRPIKTSEFKLKAPRPKNTAMSVNKLETHFNYKIPNWETSLKLLNIWQGNN